MPLTATSMTSSGVSLQVARCSTWLTPARARSTSARSAMLPRTTSSRSPASKGRLWQSARSRMRASAGSARTRRMKFCPTLPAAPVTNSSMSPSRCAPAEPSTGWVALLHPAARRDLEDPRHPVALQAVDAVVQVADGACMVANDGQTVAHGGLVAANRQVDIALLLAELGQAGVGMLEDRAMAPEPHRVGREGLRA